DIEMEEVRGTMDYASLDDYWTVQTAVAGPISGIVRTLPDDQQREIKTTLETLVGDCREDDGSYRFPTLALGVTAREAAWRATSPPPPRSAATTPGASPSRPSASPPRSRRSSATTSKSVHWP